MYKMKIINVSNIYKKVKLPNLNLIGFTITYEDGSFDNIIEFFDKSNIVDIVTSIENKHNQTLKVFNNAKIDHTEEKGK